VRGGLGRDESHRFRWFSHEPFHETEDQAQAFLGLYSATYVGAGDWDNLERKRALKEFSEFTGNHPSHSPVFKTIGESLEQ
jgi:hypothetical protein